MVRRYFGQEHGSHSSTVRSNEPGQLFGANIESSLLVRDMGNRVLINNLVICARCDIEGLVVQDPAWSLSNGCELVTFSSPILT